MNRSNRTRLDRIEAALAPAPKPEVRVLYTWMEDDDSSAEIEAMIASGKAAANDLFVIIRKFAPKEVEP